MMMSWNMPYSRHVSLGTMTRDAQAWKPTWSIMPSGILGTGSVPRKLNCPLNLPTITLRSRGWSVRQVLIL